MIRTRFAPSPTGPLHIGGVRTALYNYLFAKKNKGQFILRLEDTDQARNVQQAGDYIVNALKWCHIIPDEGFAFGGPLASYKQSDRKAIYKEHIDWLLTQGKAYLAFDTESQLRELRAKQEAMGLSFSYNAQTRNILNNQIALGEEKTQALLKSGHPYVVRFAMPYENKKLILQDLIRGSIEVDTHTLDDKVLFKSDGMPTYHLANVVDDHLMQISHVIRGEEWLPSMALHVLLYEAFGWELPNFAHLPLLLKPQGGGKLSKRDGQTLGFPVFPLSWTDSKTGQTSIGYKEAGYLPEAFVNMLALLGWNPGDDKEIFNLNELINVFDLDRVSKSGARFSKEKALWFNHQYIEKIPNLEFVAYLKAHFLSDDDVSRYNSSQLIKIVESVKPRLNTLLELQTETSFYFKAPTTFNPNDLKKLIDAIPSEKLVQLASKIKTILPFEASFIEKNLKSYIKQESFPIGKTLQTLRIALVGAPKGPDLFTMMELLGSQQVNKRILYYLEENV